MFILSHEAQNRLGVLVRLLLGRGAGIFAVIRQFLGATQVADGVGVDDGGAAARHHGPDAAGPVQNGQFQRSTALRVQIGDVRLFRVGVAPERWRVIDLAPFRAAHKVRGGVDLGSEIEHVDVAGVGHHQRVDLEVREVQIHVQVVQRANEACQAPE